MTFLKRHWPDVLIVAVIAVLLSGFLLVLLGRPQVTMRLPFGSTTPTPVERVDAVAPVSQTEAVSVKPPLSETATAEPVVAAAPEPRVQDIPTIPAAPANQSEAPVAETVAPSLSATPEVILPPARDVVATSRQGAPTRSDFRLGAGVFPDEATARARTAPINELGYVVHLIAVEQGVVAQIGPFATQAEAERAQQQIRAVHTPLTLQPPLGQTLTPAQGEGTQETATRETSTPPAEVEAAVPVAAPATATGTYLQVGAFSTPEYAAPLIERLRTEGLAPSVNAPPGQKIRVLVGPYGPDALQSAQQQLDALGIQHFRVR